MSFMTVFRVISLKCPVIQPYAFYCSNIIAYSNWRFYVGDKNWEN
jgi:hypothetical protein